MKEYKVMAFFNEDCPPHSGAPRSYKHKVTRDPEEAQRILKEAKEYYSKYKYLDRVVLVSREVGEWEEEK